MQHSLIVASRHCKVKEDAQRLRADAQWGKVGRVVQALQRLEAQLDCLAILGFLPELRETRSQEDFALFRWRVRNVDFAGELLAMILDVLSDCRVPTR